MALLEEDNIVNNPDSGSLRETDTLLGYPASGQGLVQSGGIQIRKDDDPSGNMAQWSGTPHVKGSSETVRMALLTFSIIGLQSVYPAPIRNKWAD